MTKPAEKTVQQSIKRFQLDLSGYNVILPVIDDNPYLSYTGALLAGADKIFLCSGDKTDKKIPTKPSLTDSLELPENVCLVENLTSEILSEADILIKGGNLYRINDDLISSLKKGCVISVLPERMDFEQVNDIDPESCNINKIPVVVVKSDDETLSLHKYLAHYIVKELYQSGVDIFRSKVMLLGSGKALNEALSILKPIGATVYLADISNPESKEYVLKHLPELDTLIVADFEQKIQNLHDIISVEDLTITNRDINLVHFAGKLDISALKLAKTNYFPTKISQSLPNVKLLKLGQKTTVDLITASLKAGELLSKSRKSIHLSNSVLSYNLLKTGKQIILGPESIK